MLFYKNLDKIESKNSMEVTDLALKISEELKVGEEFTLKDLFPSFLWKRLPINIRLATGTIFYSKVCNGQFSIVATTKSSQNQQKYKKI